MPAATLAQGEALRLAKKREIRGSGAGRKRVEKEPRKPLKKRLK
jgi:hypothetical protein